MDGGTGRKRDWEERRVNCGLDVQEIIINISSHFKIFKSQ